MDKPQSLGMAKSKLWITALLSLPFAWVLPIFLWLIPKIDERTGLFLSLTLLWGVVGGLVVITHPRSPWSVHLWIPLLAAPITFTLIILSQFDWKSSSGPGAPLEGVATLFGLLFVAGCGVLILLTFLARPVVYHPINLTCATLNTGLALFAASSAYAHSTRLEIMLTLFDRAGKPVPGASVSFERYSYGPGGGSIHAESRGPYLTDLQGRVVLTSRRMRNETQIAISKPGYRDLQLKLPMQFSRNQEQRSLTLSTKETRAIATLQLPAFEPLPISLALPPADESPDPNLQRFYFRSTRDPSPQPERYLDIETGTLTRELNEAPAFWSDAPPTADLRRCRGTTRALACSEVRPRASAYTTAKPLLLKLQFTKTDDASRNARRAPPHPFKSQSRLC